ncbi:MAG: hypothetical protein HOC91_18510 [Nitrospinaceae bacterium]|jgi:hypothetical protein|nr:hypothetical protein [Nitrospinaceae bacterium]MBT3435680.1 hypothetical protein [Nitrospinaceae bacterium]MBT3821107.1 hypothetical protein [Nitrospinaceae bacterium]MBT4094249.1 hypothetical protein [Nitrospinaceae bacterium]MBT4432507.1 hypothetical protein [Nitrospinaceae bacterium]
MEKRFVYISGAITLLGVLLLSALWEFYLEDIFLPMLGGHHEPEPLWERWEYIASAVFFAGIAIGISTLISLRFIKIAERHKQELEEAQERFKNSILTTPWE